MDITSDMEAKLVNYRSYFEESQHFCTNEKLREETVLLGPQESHFGLDGSFRQLIID